MAFFKPSHFSNFMTEAQAVMAAKEANNLMDQYGTIMYGTKFSDNSCREFGTVKKQDDTHVCIALDISMMGSMEPSKVPVKLDRPTKEDLDLALKDKLRDLEKRNAVLEAQIGGRHNGR